MKPKKTILFFKENGIALLAMFVIFSVPALAQNSDGLHGEALPETEESNMVASGKTHGATSHKEAVIWSQDFANGIPSTWVNQGFTRDVNGNLTPNTFCKWEYRGPSTTPSNSLGSRGQFAGSGPTIQSLTDANGFIIFDSDYWDSDGISGNRGGGVCPAPHIGTLTTDTIDLTGVPNVEVSIYSRARQRTSAFMLAVSNDGGVTYPDTVEFHAGLASNSTSNGGSQLEVTANISSTAGGQSMVVLQLVHEGLPGTSPGLYYWQVDDMEVRSLPEHAFKFVEYNSAPPTDIIYPSDSPEYGNPQKNQVQPIGFDANFINFGSEDQTNVRLKVEIQDSTGAVINTLTSSVKAVLASGDTGNFNDFTVTGTWTPPGLGVYEAFWTIESDSVPLVAPTIKDSITFRVNERIHGGHFSRFNNDIGTEEDRAAVAQAFTFPSSHKDSSGYALIDGVNIYFSTATDPGGSVQVSIYESTRLTFGTTGGPRGALLAQTNFLIDTGSIGSWAFIDFRNNGAPFAINSDSGCYVVISLFTNGAGDEIQIGNDQTIIQPSPLKAMQRDDGRWFSFFTGSRTFSNLLLEMVVSPEGIGLEENTISPSLFDVFPQPADDGKVTLTFNNGGTYDVEILSQDGKVVYRENVAVNKGDAIKRDFSKLAVGSYFIKISDGKDSSVKNLILR